MKVGIESIVSHLTLCECVRKMCFLLHFLLMENDMKSAVGRCNALAPPAAVHECDKITALVMERGRKAFEAIIDNQNSAEPREGEEIESNGEGGEGESWSGTVWRT